MKSKVYFSRTITPEKVVELFQLTGKTLDGNTAIKIHSGEVGNQNFLKPDFPQHIWWWCKANFIGRRRWKRTL